MEAIKLLEEYKKRLDVALNSYFQKKIKEAGNSHSLAKEAVKMIADFTLNAGKRIRPALVYYAYLAQGGKNQKDILEASMSIELVHTFLLIHDDIIDKDEKRHGVPTIHERYKKIGRKLNTSKNCEHFGNSMAMLAGDLASAMANEIIFNSNFPPSIIVEALDRLQQIVYNIVPGEMLDVVLETKGKAVEKEILKMYEGKTASYSFEGPLHLGVTLAEKNNKEILCKFSRYAIPVGIAFQIKDDILGIFGSEKRIGKPVGSDISEGKQTLLLIKAKEKATGSQREILNRCIGKADLSKEEMEDFRKVIRDTGSLEYSEKMADRYIKEAIETLSDIDFKNNEAKLFLRGIAEYMINREK